MEIVQGRSHNISMRASVRFSVEMFGYSHSCWIGLRPPEGTTGGMWLRINKISTDFTLQSLSGIIPVEWREGWNLSSEAAAHLHSIELRFTHAEEVFCVKTLNFFVCYASSALRICC